MSYAAAIDVQYGAKWYRGTVDYFADEDKAKERKDGGKESGLVADRGKEPWGKSPKPESP